MVHWNKLRSLIFRNNTISKDIFCLDITLGSASLSGSKPECLQPYVLGTTVLKFVRLDDNRNILYHVGLR